MIFRIQTWTSLHLVFASLSLRYTSMILHPGPWLNIITTRCTSKHLFILINNFFYDKEPLPWSEHRVKPPFLCNTRKPHRRVTGTRQSRCDELHLEGEPLAFAGKGLLINNLFNSSIQKLQTNYLFFFLNKKKNCI